MKKWTLREFFWKFKSAFFGLSDGTIFKILPRFFGFFAFLTPLNSAELVLKKVKRGGAGWRSYGTNTPYKSTPYKSMAVYMAKFYSEVPYAKYRYHAYGSKFEIRNSKFDIINRPGGPVLTKFRILRPGEKPLLTL